jgi:hypothetical protein
MLDDDSETRARVTLADIRPGDFLEIEALRQADGLVATRINRDEPGGELLQGALEKFSTGDSITLLGITYSTAGAQFKSLDGASLTPMEFYAALVSGTLVKVRDNAPADGIADSVELEYERALDGEREFEDEEVDGGSDSDDEVDQPDGDDEIDVEDGNEDSVDQSEDSVDQSEDSVEQPEDSLEQADDPVEEPQVEQPEGV